MRRLSPLLAVAALALLPACAHAQSALLQNPAHQVTISDHVHGSMMFAPSVFLSPNSPGILNLASGNPLILQKGVATTGTDAGDFRFDRNANYAGGTHGFVNPALYGNCAVSAGAISFEWCGLFKMDNSSSAADAAENVAVYAQSHKRNGGATWALVAELQDHNANPTTPSVTLEFDLQTKGTDTNNARVIQDLWGKTDDGNPTVIGNGMRFNTDASTTLTNGLTFQGATISNATIALGAGQKLCLDGLTCANSISQSAGTTTFKNGGVTALTTSSIGSNVIALNSSGQVTLPSGQKLCLDGTTCANYLSQSAGTVTLGATAGGAGTTLFTGLGINTVGLAAVGPVSGATVTAGSTLTDTGVKLLVRGITKGIRMYTAAGGSTIEGVDQTGSASYQPLALGGSQVGVSINGGPFADIVTTAGGQTINGNLALPTNGKLCLNGSSCTIYLLFDGTSIGFFNSGVAKFQMNMTSGNGGPAGAVTSGISTGVSCGAGSHQTVGGVTTVC